MMEEVERERERERECTNRRVRGGASRPAAGVVDGGAAGWRADQLQECEGGEVGAGGEGKQGGGENKELEAAVERLWQVLAPMLQAWEEEQTVARASDGEGAERPGHDRTAGTGRRVRAATLPQQRVKQALLLLLLSVKVGCKGGPGGLGRALRCFNWLLAALVGQAGGGQQGVREVAREEMELVVRLCELLVGQVEGEVKEEGTDASMVSWRFMTAMN